MFLKNIKALSCVVLFLFLSSCGTYFNQPLQQRQARFGEQSKSTKKLLDLPKASVPVEVAVYNFSDQTGQYKAINAGSTFSTAVTQGGTTILIKALEDSGWFKPIERENLSNLSTERNIIRNTKQEYIKNLNPNEPPLPPLLYAGLILEGGIISYDTNTVTGGFGARYFGVGGSTQYRQDRISVYLRAVSTNNGQILKTVYVSKTILSQALDANFFRFVKFQRLLEAETGFTKNEPVQIAVQDAIEKAVHDLIMEGIKEGYWTSANGRETDELLVAAYEQEKSEEESLELYNRKKFDVVKKHKVSAASGTSLINADYATKNPAFFARMGVGYGFTENLSLNGSVSIVNLDSGEQFSSRYVASDLNVEFDLLPFDVLSPFLYAGAGYFTRINKGPETNLSGLEVVGEDGVTDDNTYKFQYGAGLTYRFSPSWDVRLFAEHNILFSDAVDGIISGRRDDHYWIFGAGLTYKFNF